MLLPVRARWGTPRSRVDGVFDGVELGTDGWDLQALQVDEVQSSFFEDRSRFPAGTVQLRQRLRHAWTRDELASPAAPGCHGPGDGRIVTVLAFSDRCRAFQTYGRGDREAPPLPPEPGIVGRWAGAGAVAGACLGALLGVVVIVAEGLWPVALLGAAFGMVPGATIGAVVGALDGIVLRRVNPGSLTRLDPAQRRQRTAIVAIATAIAGFAILYPLFGGEAGAVEQVALVYAPVATGTILAAVLSRRLD